jgi:hypothetical protein
MTRQQYKCELGCVLVILLSWILIAILVMLVRYVIQ